MESQSPILQQLPKPQTIEVGDMFGNAHEHELVIALKVFDENGKTMVMPQFGIQVAASDLLDDRAGYVYLGRVHEVFLGIMKEDAGVEDDEEEEEEEDEEDDEDDEDLDEDDEDLDDEDEDDEDEDDEEDEDD